MVVGLFRKWNYSSSVWDVEEQFSDKKKTVTVMIE